VGADHTAVFLAHDLELVAVDAFEVDGVGDIGAVQFDGQAGAQIHTEGVMGQKHNGLGRQGVDQSLANHLGVGVGQVRTVDFPDFGVGLGRGLADGVQIGAASGHDRGHGRIRKNFAGGRDQFDGTIIRHAVFVGDICKHLCGHYLIPPLAFKISMIFSTFSSMLPSIISAPSPSSGTK
jgi:hypothetical protein